MRKRFREGPVRTEVLISSQLRLARNTKVLSYVPAVQRICMMPFIVHFNSTDDNQVVVTPRITPLELRIPIVDFYSAVSCLALAHFYSPAPQRPSCPILLRRLLLPEPARQLSNVKPHSQFI